MLARKMLVGLAEYECEWEWVDGYVASKRLGAGETELLLLEEGDLGGGRCVGLAVEFLVGWFR